MNRAEWSNSRCRRARREASRAIIFESAGVIAAHRFPIAGTAFRECVSIVPRAHSNIDRGDVCCRRQRFAHRLFRGSGVANGRVESARRRAPSTRRAQSNACVEMSSAWCSARRRDAAVRASREGAATGGELRAGAWVECVAAVRSRTSDAACGGTSRARSAPRRLAACARRLGSGSRRCAAGRTRRPMRPRRRRGCG